MLHFFPLFTKPLRERHNVLVISLVITLAVKDKVGKQRNFIYTAVIKRKGGPLSEKGKVNKGTFFQMVEMRVHLYSNLHRSREAQIHGDGARVHSEPWEVIIKWHQKAIPVGEYRPSLELKYTPIYGDFVTPAGTKPERHVGHFIFRVWEWNTEGRLMIRISMATVGFDKSVPPSNTEVSDCRSYKSWMRYYFRQKSQSKQHFLEQSNSSLWRYKAQLIWHLTSKFPSVLYCDQLSKCPHLPMVWNFLDVWLCIFFGPIPATI